MYDVVEARIKNLDQIFSYKHENYLSNNNRSIYVHQQCVIEKIHGSRLCQRSRCLLVVLVCSTSTTFVVVVGRSQKSKKGRNHFRMVEEM